MIVLPPTALAAPGGKNASRLRKRGMPLFKRTDCSQPGMAQGVEPGPQCWLARREITATIPLPAAEYVGIGREYQRLVARRGRAGHDVFRNRSILHYIELHPQAAPRLFGHILEPGCRHCAQGEWNAETSRRPREPDVAIGVQHTVQAGGADDQRSRRFTPEDLGSQVAARRIDQRLWNELQRFEGGAIAAQRCLFFRPPFDVLKDEVRYTPARNGAQVGNVQRARKIAAAEGATLPRHESLACLLFDVDRHVRGGKRASGRIILACRDQLDGRVGAVDDRLDLGGES